MPSKTPPASAAPTDTDLRVAVRRTFLDIIDQPKYRKSVYGRKLPLTLSHYTDAGGAAGIIGKGEFWASHALFMNDAKELRLVRPIFERLVADALPKSVPDDQARQTVVEALWEGFDVLTDDPGIYVTCFSTHDDQLGQWRGYGFAGGGYSISYETKLLTKLIEGRRDLHLVRVIYDEDRQFAVTEDLFTRMMEVLMKRYAGLTDPDAKDRVLRRAGYGCAEFAHSFAYRFKDPAFAEENEWRLIYQTNANDNGHLDRDFREARGRLLPFVRLPVGQSDRDLAIEGLVPTKVRVGPTATPQLAEQAMRYLLVDAGMPGVDVVHSSIPLRS